MSAADPFVPRRAAPRAPAETSAPQQTRARGLLYGGLTTAIALETSKGNLALALALGLILVAIALGVNAAAALLGGISTRRFA